MFYHSYNNYFRSVIVVFNKNGAVTILHRQRSSLHNSTMHFIHVTFISNDGNVESSTNEEVLITSTFTANTARGRVNPILSNMSE